MGAPRHPGASLLEELTDLLGAAAVEALVRDFGGIEFYVPQNPAANHRLIDSLGDLATARFVDSYGGERLFIPLPPGKARRILAAAAEGLTPREIQRRVRCSERWVLKVLERAKGAPEDPQADLFT